MDKWAYENKVTLDYSRPGKPTHNPFIESFNGSFRDKCLNTHCFLSLKDAYEKISSWAEEYNHYRLHSSLNGKTPAEVVEEQLIKQQNVKLCIWSYKHSQELGFDLVRSIFFLTSPLFLWRKIAKKKIY